MKINSNKILKKLSYVQFYIDKSKIFFQELEKWLLDDTKTKDDINILYTTFKDVIAKEGKL